MKLGARTLQWHLECELDLGNCGCVSRGWMFNPGLLEFSGQVSQDFALGII